MSVLYQKSGNMDFWFLIKMKELVYNHQGSLVGIYGFSVTGRNKIERDTIRPVSNQ